MNSTIPASRTPVKSFRQILVLPFVNAAPTCTTEGRSPQKDPWFKRVKIRLNGRDSPQSNPWTPVNPADLMDDGAVVGLYEEAVYFHDFLRHTLYQEDDGFCTYQRKGLRRLDFTIGGEVYRFGVPFNALHIYEAGVAILTLELVHIGPIDLAKAQTVIDQLRRAYPPFWDPSGKPGLSPSACTVWESPVSGGAPQGRSFNLDPVREPAGGNETTADPLRNRASARKALLESGMHEPLFSWWTHLLGPLTVQGNASGTDGEPLLRQVLDERIPLISTLSLTREDKLAPETLQAVSDGDWFRIALADSAGSGTYSYNPDFLETQRADLFYDRFFPFEGDSLGQATRFTFAGYHFAAVGAGWFFDTFVVEHNRRHYRHMMHVCLLEFATLLGISQDLCQAVDARDAKDEEHEDVKTSQVFGEQIIATQKSFMDFTHKFHFTGVSNQLQAREMFDKMRESMELDLRYNEIRAELASATELALAEEQRATTEAQKATTEAAQDLTEVATIAAVIGVAAALLGMNVFFKDGVEDLEAFGFSHPLLADAFAFGAALSATAIGAIAMFAKRLFSKDHSTRLQWSLGVLVVIGFVLMLGSSVL